MFYAYVIKSLNCDYYYKGHCEDLEKRLSRHNAGATQSKKIYTPFIIVYFEEFAFREDVIKREKYFKSAACRRYLKNKLVP
jgi:putative endonuclease